MGYKRAKEVMKKVLIIVGVALSLNCMAWDNKESANKIAEAVNPNYCTTADGQPGTLRRTGSTVTTTTSTTNSSTSNQSYGSSNSNSVSTSASAGFQGIKPSANVSSSMGNSSSSNRSQSQGNGTSSTTTTTRQDTYSCYPYGK